MTIYMGRYDISKVDSINPTTNQFTGVFVDELGSYTSLDADTNDRVIQRGYDLFGRVVYDSYRIIGIISRDAENLVVNVVSDNTSGIRNRDGLPYTGSFPLTTSINDTSKFIFQVSPYQNKIDFDYDAAIANLNLNELFYHNHSGVYEPSISKSTGYAKWNGSAWSFANDTYVTGTPWTSMGYVTGTPWTSMGYITGFTETDPLVSAWAKAGTKPSYSYSEVGAASSGHNHSGTYEPSISKSTGYAKWNGSAWSFANDTYVTGTPWTSMGYVTGTPWTSMGYITGFTETDPLVSAWAKAGTKPSYSYSEVGAASSDHDHSGTYEPSISKSTGYAKWTGSAWSFVNDTYVTGTPWTSMGYVTGTPWTSMGYITGYTETDPLVSSWAKASTKPSYSYSEVGAASSGHDHSGTYEPSISKSTGYAKWTGSAWSFVNDTYVTGTPWTSMGYVTGTPWTSMGYITGYTETDPLVSSWAKASTKPSYSYSEVGAASSGHDHSGTYEPSIPKTGAGYLIYSAGAWSWLNEVYLKDDVRWYTNETGVSHFCIAPNTYLGGKTLKQINLFTSLIISRYGGFSWGGATPPYALYVNGFSRFDSTANFTKNIKVSDSISGPKFRITKEGGYAVKMTAGENLQRGRIVVSEDDGSVSKVYNIANSSNIPIGIVYDTAVNGNSVWVVINGIADIKVELDGGAYNGYIIGIYDDGDGFVDGSATAIDSYFHIYGCSLPWAFPVKIGTWIETKSTAGWAKGIVNIQPVQMISSCP